MAAEESPSTRSTRAGTTRISSSSALISSLSEEILSSMVGITTARDAWSTLEKMFASSSRARVMQIRMQLATIQKNDLSIADYYHKVKRLSDTLAAVGKRIEEEELIAYMLQGLGPDYNSLITSITTRCDSYMISDMYAHMLDFVNRQDLYNSTSQVSANAANRNSGRGGGNGGRNSRGRGGRNQGGRTTRPPQRTSNNHGANNTNGPLCQICKKPNHDALQCWHRFDQAYQAEDATKYAAKATSNDTNWYVDTGATDHITNNMERLTVKERYNGGDQIHVANGAGPSNEEYPPHRQV